MKIKHIISTIALVGLTVIAFQVLKSLQPLSTFSIDKNFKPLTGWNQADLKPSLLAFRNSCKVFLKQNPERNVGNKHFSLKAKDWQPACRAALDVDEYSGTEIQSFFQAWFKPVAISGNKPTKGLFTGYYAATVAGSRHQTDHYATPIYAVKNHTVLAWVASNKDRTTLKTEGSAIIKMDNGSSMAIEYIKGHGNQLYFQETPDHEFHGAQDVALSPGYSMAIDRNWIPLGTPLWLTTTMREDFSKKAQPFHRLMVAQDIGSAIRGAVRGDLYLGEGKQATKVGSNIHNEGQYWLLLPKQAV